MSVDTLIPTKNNKERKTKSYCAKYVYFEGNGAYFLRKYKTENAHKKKYTFVLINLGKLSFISGSLNMYTTTILPILNTTSRSSYIMINPSNFDLI